MNHFYYVLAAMLLAAIITADIVNRYNYAKCVVKVSANSQLTQEINKICDK